jgi:hypothetical protein
MAPARQPSGKPQFPFGNQSLKRFTAREGNRMLGRTGQPFWQAGLAAKPEDFPWSSARPIHNRPAG